MKRALLALACLPILAGCAKLPASTAVSQPTATTTTSSAIKVPQLTDAQINALPESTTNGNIANSPIDNLRSASTDGTVVHNSTTVPVFTEPGGQPFAKLPAKQLQNDTWLPIIGGQPGWVEVLLPSKPNGSVGWIDASKVQSAHTPYVIKVQLTTKKLELIDNGSSVGSWTVAIGAAGTPTPTGRTFLLAQIHDPTQSFSPIIIPLGTHSATMDKYGGGPGTVAIHTWLTNGRDTPSIYGQAVSHGCVRVPAVALQRLQQVPLGTLVQIS